MKPLADHPVLRETSPLYNEKKSELYPALSVGMIAAFLSAHVDSSAGLIKQLGAINLNRNA